MLLLVVLAVRPEKPTIAVGLGPAEGVELMVPHYGERRARVTHAFCNMKHLTLFWSTIDKIANENYLTFRVPKDTITIAIAHCSQ
jgi:hypothetical protein